MTDRSRPGPDRHLFHQGVEELRLADRFRQANRDRQSAAACRVLRLAGRRQEQQPYSSDSGLSAYRCGKVEPVHLGHHAVDQGDGIRRAAPPRFSARPGPRAPPRPQSDALPSL